LTITTPTHQSGAHIDTFYQALHRQHYPICQHLSPIIAVIEATAARIKESNVTTTAIAAATIAAGTFIMGRTAIAL
jgi:hypothetical protein